MLDAEDAGNYEASRGTGVQGCVGSILTLENEILKFFGFLCSIVDVTEVY